MSAEYFMRFEAPGWYLSNATHVEAKISALSTLSNRVPNAEFWLTGTERRPPQAWLFDVRIFLKPNFIFLEISNHPPSIYQDLSTLFSWLRQQTQIIIEDEDRIPSGW
jgi:hypothetical protein